MVVTSPLDYYGDDAVLLLCKTFDGFADPNGYEYGWSATPTATVRPVTDFIWAEYMVRNGHATVEELAPPSRTLRADRPHFRITVEPNWSEYQVVRETDDTPVDLDKTFAEQELTDHIVRVRLFCAEPMLQEGDD